MEHVLLAGSAVWNRLFKRNIFDRIRFPAGRVNDDEVTALHAYAECGKILFLDHDTYYYRIRQNSITTSKFSLRNMDCYYNSMDNLAFVREKMPGLEAAGEYKYIKSMLYCYVNLKRMKREPEVKELLERLHRDIRDNRSAALSNRYVSLPLKALMLLSAI